MIVIDDGSRDASAEIIRGYGDRVRSVFGPNRGVSAARNTGVEMARGRYLQFLDHDDLLLPGALESRAGVAERAAADIVYGDWRDLVETGPGEIRPGPVHVLPDPADIADLEAVCATAAFWAPSVALLHRRAFLLRLGGFKSALDMVEDARLLFDAAAAGGRFRRCPGVGAHYRIRPDSTSRSDHPRFIRGCCRNNGEIEAIWRGRGPLSPSQVRALTSMWRHAAMGCAALSLAEFDAARAAYNRLGPSHPAIEAAALLRRGLGPGLTGAMARPALALYDLARGQSGPHASARGR